MKTKKQLEEENILLRGAFQNLFWMAQGGKEMNELNYASLEVSKKLHDAGIVLDTDVVWAWIDQNPKGTISEAYLKPTLYLKSLLPNTWFTCIVPAPCFVEVWRELPLQTYIKKMDNISTMAWICDEHSGLESQFIINEDPTDALIDLLIWVRKEQGNENIGII